jgi:hypothetical protein
MNAEGSQATIAYEGVVFDTSGRENSKFCDLSSKPSHTFPYRMIQNYGIIDEDAKLASIKPLGNRLDIRGQRPLVITNLEG